MNDDLPSDPGKERLQSRVMVTGGMVGAILASSCCILPLLFVSLGVGGAWMGNLTAMAPYQPFFTVMTLAFLGYGYYLVYGKPKRDCREGEVCATPVAGWVVKTGLFLATLLIIAAMAAQYLPAEYLDF